MDCLKNLKLNKKKTALILSVFLFVVVAVLGIFKSVDADGLDTITDIGQRGVLMAIGNILELFIGVAGTIATIIVSAIMAIAPYNNFINEPSIVMAWGIIRDFSNMFFILILLVIAFATILRIESYNMKKWLPKLLIMAVLINFSRTIAGLIIDFAQVFMLTFVSAIGVTGSSIINSLGVQNYFSLTLKDVVTGTFTKGDYVDFWGTLTGLVLGVVFLIIATVVLGVFLSILLIRMAMLWIYVVLSPLAFLLAAFPGGQKYSSRWWDEFIKNVITGPILMFFFWLALVTSNNYTIGGNISSAECIGSAQTTCPNTFMHFFIAIGMLIGGLIITQQAGGAVGGMASKGMGAINKGRSMAWGGTKFGADYLNRKQATGKRGTGIDFNIGRQIARLKESSERNKHDDITAMRMAANKNLAYGGMRGLLTGVTATGWGDQYVKGFLGRKGLAMAFKGNKGQLKKLGDKRDDKQFRADNSMTTSQYNVKHSELNERETKAVDTFDNKELAKVKEERETLNKVNELGLVFSTEEKATSSKIKYQEDANKIGARYSELAISDIEGRKEQEQAQAEEESKLKSTNEDELIAAFNSALAKENPAQAMAIARAIAKVGGFNALLAKNGYQASAGLTKEESAKLSESERMKQRGMNDFMRDIFVDKLKAGEQTMLALQTDLNGIGEGINHGYMFKQVGVDTNGKLYQSSSEKRNAVIDSENSKKESEGIIRKANRLYFGAEDINDPNGKFKFSQPGLKEFVKNWQLISKEIDNKRFNKSTASSIVDSPEAMKNLREVMSSLKGELGSDKNGLDAEQFLDVLEKYAKTSAGETAKAINSKINSVVKS